MRVRGLRRWGPRELVASWVVYWTILLVVALWPAIMGWWRIQNTTGHGSVSLSLSWEGLRTAWWIAGPPLLMWLVWVRTRPKR